MRMRLAGILSTCFGLGFFPVAPGTVVSLAAVFCYLSLPVFQNFPVFVVAIVLASITGVWSGGVMEEKYGDDPSVVTIDELAGQMLGFLFFRFFDIAKPGPVDRAQRFPGGWGIMADDLLAGLFANLSVHAVLTAASLLHIVLPL